MSDTERLEARISATLRLHVRLSADPYWWNCSCGLWRTVPGTANPEDHAAHVAAAVADAVLGVPASPKNGENQ